MLFNEQKNDIDPDATAIKVDITVKRNGFKATFYADYSDGGWTEHSKAFPNKTIGQVRRELSLMKTDLIAKGQPADSITIKFI